jgi:Ca-activated chloride channel family protein
MSALLPLLGEDEARVAPADEAGFGALTTARGGLPLTALDVHARLDGLLAEVSVEQTFVNPLAEPLEATYVFPLPDRAAVTRFSMRVAGRLVEGVLQERAGARREYAQAVEQGRRAAIAEEERPGVFTLRVGNLMPGESAVVRLSLTGPLAYSDGEATFRFPLVVAPRYVPGVPLAGPSAGAGTAANTDAVPDASRIRPPVLLPGFSSPVRLSLTVDVPPSELGLSDFRSALHSVMQVVGDSGARRVLLQAGERLDRDFILRFRVGVGSPSSRPSPGPATALTLTPDAPGASEGTFALTLVPPVAVAQEARPRDVVFVLDRSGSMGGWKMVAARRALEDMVETLTERDRFAVYAFDDRVEAPPALGGLGLQAATDRNRFRAVEFLAGVEARGGTEMAQPLSMAAHLLAGADPGRDRALVLITDGQVANEDQVLRVLGDDLKRVRVFALGIDRAVNAAFLRRLADLGGGACELVESEERLDEVLAQAHHRLGAPVLTGLRLEGQGLQISEGSVVPGRLPDLFAGAPLFVLGRYRGAAGGLRLSATDAGGKGWSHEVVGRVGEGGAAPSVWARGHVRALEDRHAIGQDDRAALEKRIVETSLKYGVLCRFTAFVAVDRSETVNWGGPSARMIQPVEAPAGWADASRALMPAWAASLPVAAAGGRWRHSARTLSPSAVPCPEPEEETEWRGAALGARGPVRRSFKLVCSFWLFVLAVLAFLYILLMPRP